MTQKKRPIKYSKKKQIQEVFKAKLRATPENTIRKVASNGFKWLQMAKKGPSGTPGAFPHPTTVAHI